MRALVTRLDSFGDVLLAGPAVRAVAARADHVTLLCGPHGAPAARLLPGVDEVIVWESPWTGFRPPPVDRDDIGKLVASLDADAALVLTSFHQSPLPTALLLRLAGVPFIAADSEDHPGSLLDVRHHRAPHAHEAEAALDLAEAAGFPRVDDGRLRVLPPPAADALTGDRPYVVVHPGASVPARAWSPGRCAQAVRELTAAGRRVVVTGGAGSATSPRTSPAAAPSTWAAVPTPRGSPGCSPGPTASSRATPAPPISPPPSAPPWCRCSRRSSPPSGGAPTACPTCCSATRTPRAPEAAPGAAPYRAIPAWTP